MNVNQEYMPAEELGLNFECTQKILHFTRSTMLTLGPEITISMHGFDLYGLESMAACAVVQ